MATELYKRLCAGYEFTQTETNTSGQEVYERHDDAAGGVAYASLPTIGSSTMLDPRGSNVASCVARELQAVFDSSDPKSAKYTFKYSTVTPGTNQQRIPHDKRIRKYTISAEILTIEYPATSVKKPMYISIPKGTFTISTKALTAAENTTFFGIVVGLAGKINSAAFDTVHDVGRCLFTGISGGTSYKSTGELQYVYEMHFEFRKINHPTFGAANGDYLYFPSVDPVTDVVSWAIPTTAPYTLADFSTLLNYLPAEG